MPSSSKQKSKPTSNPSSALASANSSSTVATTPRFSLTYSKCSNRKLFSSLGDLKIEQPQNYNPFYERFFALGESNSNSVGLNQTYALHHILAKVSETTYTAVVKKQVATTTLATHSLQGHSLQGHSLQGHSLQGHSLQEEVSVFFKYSPLLDPLKYLSGKYDIVTHPTLLQLPVFNAAAASVVSPGTGTCAGPGTCAGTGPGTGTGTGTADLSVHKTRDYNNMSYVDSFFTYLCSQMLHTHGFINGIDFYGSFLGLKTDFGVNVCDDLEFLQESPFFIENQNKLFRFDDASVAAAYLKRNTRLKKIKLNMNVSNPKGGEDDDALLVLELSDIKDLQQLDHLFAAAPATATPCLTADTLQEVILDPIEHLPTSTRSSSHSNCSSRTSNTTEQEEEEEQNEDKHAGGSRDGGDDGGDDDGDNEGDDGDDDGDGDDGDDDDDDDEVVLARIHSFPVQVIALENCTSTLDALLMEKGETMSDLEWTAIVVQILMSLITFQKCFDLTHNDLHTNNIMYVPTPHEYLYYKVNNVVYKVPTFGRLFKIIDFGRAIYRFQGQLMCSDSYNADGDAFTQYNSEPFLNPLKPRIDPNPSFDLCRLGCALFDFLVDDLDDVKKIMKASAIKKLMLSWCLDDQGRNVLYKSNGDERYPDFKLYKMIARTVHNHTPLKVLQNVCFQQFRVALKKIKTVALVMDIDAYPAYQFP